MRIARSAGSVLVLIGLLYKELALSALTLIPGIGQERRLLVQATHVALDAR